EKSPRFRKVGEMPPEARLRLASSLLHRFLDVVQETEASVREEEAPVRHAAHVDATDTAALEKLGDPGGLAAETEGAREHVPEPVRHWDEGNREAHRRRGRRAERRVASHGDEIGEVGPAGVGPPEQALQVAEGLHADVMAQTLQSVPKTSRGEARSSFAR